MPVTHGTPLTDFPGVGEARAKKLEKLGLSAAGDLLACYPRDYEDRRKVYEIQNAPLEGRVCVAAMAAEEIRFPRFRLKKYIHIFTAMDSTRMPADRKSKATSSG